MGSHMPSVSLNFMLNKVNWKAGGWLISVRNQQRVHLSSHQDYLTKQKSRHAMFWQNWTKY